MAKITIFGVEHIFHRQKKGPQGYPVYQEQAQNQKGIHVPVSGCTSFPDGLERSEAGDLCRQTWGGEPDEELVSWGKRLHRKKLEEIRAFPAPKLKGI